MTKFFSKQKNKLLTNYINSSLISKLIQREELTLEEAKANFTNADLSKLNQDEIYWIELGVLPFELDNPDCWRRALFVKEYPAKICTYHNQRVFLDPLDYSDDQVSGVIDYNLSLEQVRDDRFNIILEELLLEELLLPTNYDEVTKLSATEFEELINSEMPYEQWKQLPKIEEIFNVKAFNEHCNNINSGTNSTAGSYPSSDSSRNSDTGYENPNNCFYPEWSLDEDEETLNSLLAEMGPLDEMDICYYNEPEMSL